MKHSILKKHSSPSLDNPLLIVGLPGIAGIGEIATRKIIESTKAILFAELYSPVFPDYVSVDERGVCSLPRYTFYFSDKKNNIVILSGNCQPAIDDIPAFYEICEDILNFSTSLGCKQIIVLEGTLSDQPENEVFIAYNSKKIAEEYIKKGAVLYKNGMIAGISGLLLGLAKIKGIKGICLLSSTLDSTNGREAGFRLVRALSKFQGITLK
jgi:proteasome assembly chaperone (PAC2) family protein